MSKPELPKIPKAIQKKARGRCHDKEYFGTGPSGECVFWRKQITDKELRERAEAGEWNKDFVDAILRWPRR
jgi:hypothetical protein